MLRIIIDDTLVGLCADPYGKHPEAIQVGYMLFDGDILVKLGKNGPCPPPPRTADEFDLQREDGSVAYERCFVRRFGRSYSTSLSPSLIIEDAKIAFLAEHKVRS